MFLEFMFYVSWIEKIEVAKKKLLNIMNFICYLLLVFFVLTSYQFLFSLGPKNVKKKLLSYVFRKIINLLQWYKSGSKKFII